MHLQGCRRGLGICGAGEWPGAGLLEVRGGHGGMRGGVEEAGSTGTSDRTVAGLWVFEWWAQESAPWLGGR